MVSFKLRDLLEEKQRYGDLYMEFLHVPALSMGVYSLPAGGTDPQEPHKEDEVYYVTAGRASLDLDGKEIAVETGSIVYVAAGVRHRFHSIAEALTVLVFFAPAET